MSEKILFLTGRLAERQLRRILSSMKPEFRYKIDQIGVNVAALMSENIIMRRLNKKQDVDRIIVPGKFRGSLKKLTRYFNVKVERGPDDISHLPDYFGLKKPDQKLEDYECQIFAEIVDAADISVRKILKIAKNYAKQGANVIDLGCMPDTKFDHLEETVSALKSLGLMVSIDSANSDELIRGSKAGADFVLSISEQNINILDEINSTPILIPAKPGDLNSLKRVVKLVQSKNIDFFADPI